MVLNQYADGSREWLTLSEVGLYADLPFLQYDLVPLESGTELFVELVVYDYSGDSSSQTRIVTLPDASLLTNRSGHSCVANGGIADKPSHTGP